MWFPGLEGAIGVGMDFNVLRLGCGVLALQFGDEHYFCSAESDYG